MFQYPKYLIRENDLFNPEIFSSIIDDIQIVKEQTNHVSPTFRTEILLSHFMNNAPENNWATANPELTQLIKSGSLSSANIELLFKSCANKPTFRQGVMDFIKREFAQ